LPIPNFAKLQLDHDPDHDDIRAFLGRLKTALETRDLKLLGITTDGSSLYPEPLAEVFSGVPHQLCQFSAPERNIHVQPLAETESG